MRGWSIVAAALITLGTTAQAQEELPPPKPVVGAPPLSIKVCVPVPDVKKTPRTQFGCKTVEYCVSWPDFLGRLLHKDDGDCISCKGPRTKKVLLKRVVTDEVPTTKCDLREISECGPR